MIIKRGKKAQANILVVIIIILLILALLIGLWNLINPLLKENSEVSEIKAAIINSPSISIDNVKGNLIYALNDPLNSQINITLSRGGGKSDILNISAGVRFVNRTMEKTRLINKTETKNGTRPANGTRTMNITTNYTVNASIISLIDISRSMYYMICSDSSCTTKTRCENTCLGMWLHKIDFARIANQNFIGNVFSRNRYTKMGVVGFAETVEPEYCEPYGCQSLTTDSNALINKVYSFTTHSGTNICQGLNKSIEMLKSSTNKIKAIVLMTDGGAVCMCNPNIDCQSEPWEPAKADAIAQAVRANKNNITIYTIGFGKDADNITLMKLANLTNGTYSFSDTDTLSKIYNQISGQLVTFYNQTYQYNETYEWNETHQENETYNETYQDIEYETISDWQHLVIIIYNDASSYIYRNITGKDIIGPLESRTYIIPTGGLTNITKIEIYLAGYTQSGKEITGPLLDSYKVLKGN